MDHTSPIIPTELVARLPNGSSRVSVLMHNGTLYVPLDDLGSDPVIASIMGHRVTVTSIPIRDPRSDNKAAPLGPALSIHVVTLHDVQLMLQCLSAAALGAVPRIPAFLQAITDWMRRASKLGRAIAVTRARETTPGISLTVEIQGASQQLVDELKKAISAVLLRGEPIGRPNGVPVH